MDYTALLTLKDIDKLLTKGEIEKSITKKSKVVIRLVVSEKGEYT